MAILPVLDILEGEVVRGKQGDRESYRPVNSDIVDSSNPFDVAEKIKELFGFEKFYVADLDSIMGKGDNYSILKKLSTDKGLDLAVDSGIGDTKELMGNLDYLKHFERVIFGTESIKSMEFVENALNILGEDKVVVSIDVEDSEVISSSDKSFKSVKGAVQVFREIGVKKFILLDIKRVGSFSGVNNALKEVVNEFEEEYVDFITGGGVRDISDVEEFVRSGFSEILVASALHNKSITREDICE